MKQIPFPLALETAFVLENYYSPGKDLTQAIRTAVDTPQALGLFGASASGKTHLLQAACHYGKQQGKQVAYVPMRKFLALSPEALPWQAAVICVDDIHLAAGKAAWEQQLFALLNQSHDQAITLLVAANTIGGTFALPDVQSRLQALPALHVAALDDAGIQQAVQLHAHSRGMVLSAQVLEYMVRYLSRSMEKHGQGVR